MEFQKPPQVGILPSLSKTPLLLPPATCDCTPFELLLRFPKLCTDVARWWLDDGWRWPEDLRAVSLHFRWNFSVGWSWKDSNGATGWVSGKDFQRRIIFWTGQIFVHTEREGHNFSKFSHNYVFNVFYRGFCDNTGNSEDLFLLSLFRTGNDILETCEKLSWIVCSNLISESIKI